MTPMDSLTILEFLAAPFAASLILTGIHAYLGVHVVERGVIFVDLSLAQIAALGGPFIQAAAKTPGQAWSQVSPAPPESPPLVPPPALPPLP